MKFKATLIFIFLSALTFGQSVFLRHYSVEDGLLSSEIYAQKQDSLGYLWFATSRGVSRFDGVDFVNYTVRNGLPTNSIITMFTDAKGEIWFAGYDGTLSYFDGEKIIPYKFLDTVKKLSKTYFINNLYIDSAKNLYFAPIYGGFYKIDSSGQVTDLLAKYPKNYNFIITKVGNQFFFIKQNIKGLKQDEFKVKYTDTAIYIRTIPKGLRRHVEKIGNAYYISMSNILYKITPNQITQIKNYKHEISGLYKDKNGKLWVSVLYSGVYIYSGENFSQYMLILHPKSPIAALQDREGSYWISTTESGIYYLPNFNFFNYNEYGFSDFNILSIASNKSTIYFSTFDQQVFSCQVHNNSITAINNLKLSPKSFTVHDILSKKDGSIWMLGEYLIRYKNGKSQIIKRIWRGYALAQGNDGCILATTGYGFFKFCGLKQVLKFQDSRVPSSNSIYQDNRGIIWLGSINGVFSLIKDSLYYWGNLSPLLRSRINNIAQYKNFILLATSGLGLVALRPQDSTIINITTKQGLTSDFITSILVQDSIIWLGTNEGLVKITVTDSKKFNYKLENFTYIDGLYSEEIRDIAATDNVIFLATSRGLVSFFPKKLKKQFIYPKILIDSITIDGKKVKFSHKIVLKPSQRNLTIYFKAISFRVGKNVIYKYKINGFDNTWNITKNRYIRLPKLPGGHFTFYLTAAAEPTAWSQNFVKIDIYKRLKFTQTTGFYILLVFVIGLGIGIFSHFRMQVKRKQIEYERQLMLAEQKALKSQMNPHFIFNALNSIRRFILENDIEKADYYLTSFATLMRRVLDNSRQNFISLANEIETLNLYLELEKLRFDDSFDFEIIVDPKIDIHNWWIPPMIIQPFAENAIWHGLAMKKNNGRLIIKFTLLKNNKVQCIVEDNGIGRQKAKEIAAKRKGHKSTGLANTKERLELLYKLYNKRISLHIIDLYDNQGQPAGTRVELLFPNFD